MSKIRNLEIPIHFYNYKLLEDKEFILKGSNVYFIQGPNEVGKTSFLTALQGVMTAKDVTDKKVTINDKGKDSGMYEFTIPAADGSMVTIKNEFTDSKNKFTAILEDGTKISKVSDIRDLFNYTPINVPQFFAMSKTAEGRRKQRDIILKLLSDELREQFNTADLKESHFFKERTGVGRDMDNAKNNMDSIIIPDEDLKLLEVEDKAKILLEKYETIVKNRTSTQFTRDAIVNLRAERLRILERVEEIEIEVVEMEKYLGEKEEEATAELSDEMMESKVSDGKKVIERIIGIRSKQTIKKESKEKYEKLSLEHEELSTKITLLRDEKTDIVANSDLPVEDISFKDDYLVIDGFVFDETQVCESDAVLLLANILAKINPGPIQVIGDASILDAKKLDQLNTIAEQNNKLMFVDEVVRFADEITVVGYEDIPTEKKGKATPKAKKTQTKKPLKEKLKEDIKPVDKNNQESDDKPLF